QVLAGSELVHPIEYGRALDPAPGDGASLRLEAELFGDGDVGDVLADLFLNLVESRYFCRVGAIVVLDVLFEQLLERHYRLACAGGNPHEHSETARAPFPSFAARISKGGLKCSPAPLVCARSYAWPLRFARWNDDWVVRARDQDLLVDIWIAPLV